MVDEYVPAWVLCELCQRVEVMQKDGPPGPGNHVVLVTRAEAERRAALLADDDETQEDAGGD